MAEDTVITANVTAGTEATVSPKATTPPSSEIKSQINAIKEAETAQPKKAKNVTTNKSPLQKPDTKASEEIRQQILSGQSAKSENVGGTKENAEPKQSEKAEAVEDRSTWFDADKGFKTVDDFKKSYAELQTKLTKQSEEVKAERSRLELEQAQIRQEVESIKKLQAERVLTPEEKQKQEAIQRWQIENKDALEAIKEVIKGDLDKETIAKRSEEENQKIEQGILKERNDWLTEFNKDPQRKTLWATMEQEFKEQGDTLDSSIKDFVKNPLPYFEAKAIQKSLPSIIERAKAEAVEEYKASVKEAAEVERKTKFALPGGPKQGSGDVDVSKLSSSELGSLLKRNENG